VVSRTVVRAGLAVVLCLSLAVVGYGYATSSTAAAPADVDGAATNREAVPPRENITVVATDSNTWLGSESDGPRANAELVAFAPNGSVLYYNDSHTRYWDVDPVEGTRATVEFVYADHLNASECGAETVCTRNGIERVNLTTGETEAIYSRITPGKHSTRWHDVDRLDGDTLVVADIAQDRVFAVNTSSELVEWAWDAQSEFPPESGGPYPEDWTHLNDVELLDDGRVMVSLRNHDQVVFIDPERGLEEGWTLGSDDDHSTLYEQHNPDYIPAERGGPAVLVADSERHRLVEYRRTDGEWTQTWQWRDAQLKWPRDADRLPNGHTLVTDSNGNRVFEIDESGEVVWSVPVAFPYEAERLGTGDESAGGRAMGDPGSTVDTENGAETAASGSEGGGTLSLVGPEVNAILYVLPVWMGLTQLLALVVAVLSLLAWAALEYRWSNYRLAVHAPLSLRRGR
jgi:hypothetical protein